MTTEADLAAAARALLRDRARSFVASVPTNGVTRRFQLPHPNVPADSLSVYVGLATPVLVDPGDYEVQEEDGWIVFDSPPSANSALYIDGSYYEWFTDAALLIHAHNAVVQHTLDRPEFDLAEVSDVEEMVLAYGTVVEALFSLLLELSRDVDVNGPEGVNVPVRQRYTQVQQMYQEWSQAYKDRAAATGVGLDRIQVLPVRRKSLTWNRLVPVFRDQEYDDRATPQRIYPPISTGVVTDDGERPDTSSENPYWSPPWGMW